MKKYVSFIAPVYNVNKYLGEFLESFKNLPNDSYELLLVDDRGQENIELVTNKFEGLINLRIIKNNKNLGLGFSRNIGLENISNKATHFMFLDSDDKLGDEARRQIYSPNNNNDIVLSSSFIMFGKNKSTIKGIWKNRIFKGAGVSSAWGHLIDAKFKGIRFTSRSFEDQAYMSRLTNNKHIEWFSYPIVEYRLRKGSILNTDNNSVKKAAHITQYIEELNKGVKEGLIVNDKTLEHQYLFSYIEYLYISKRNRLSDFPVEVLSRQQKLLGKVLGFLERISRFWKVYELFAKKDFFD